MLKDSAITEPSEMYTDTVRNRRFKKTPCWRERKNRINSKLQTYCEGNRLKGEKNILYFVEKIISHFTDV